MSDFSQFIQAVAEEAEELEKQQPQRPQQESVLAALARVTMRYAQEGLSPLQERILKDLNEWRVDLNIVPTAQLVEDLGINYHKLYSNLILLESHGWVERPLGERSGWSLTRKGLKKFQEAESYE